MKKDKDKCKKSKESTIGKIIYGFLLFLPLMAIGVTCAYAIFNKNAYQSKQYLGVTNALTITNSNQFVENTEYVIEYVDNGITSNSLVYSFSKSTIPYDELNLPNLNYNGFQIIGEHGMIFANEENQFIYRNNIWGNELKSFTAILTSFTSPVTNFKIVKYTYSSYTLDNVLYYSIDKLQESNLFNWAQDSIIYTGMTEFTTSLSITNTFIPLLLTYWLIISLVYFIYDIVLIIFNVLHRKIHELQNNI